jgi:hypothetical protein
MVFNILGSFKLYLSVRVERSGLVSMDFQPTDTDLVNGRVFDIIPYT